MEEQERWEWLARAVGRERLPARVWEVLVNGGHVDDLKAGRITEGTLIDYARRLLPYGDILEQVESVPEPKDKRSSIEPLTLGGYETERAEALARYLELEVSAHAGAMKFRRERLPQRWPLSPEGAYQMVKSPNYRVMYSGIREARANQVEPSGYLEFFAGKSAEPLRIGFCPGTVFEQLHEVSQELRRDLFPPWSEAEAAWVVVTGEVRRSPLPLDLELTNHHNEHLTYGTITLKVNPWVASETVVRAYQWLQSHMLGKRPKALSQRNLRVVQFVMWELGRLVSHTAEDNVANVAPPRLSWRRLMDRWNEANPGEAYEDERHFHRDFFRTAHAVVRPYDASHWIDQPPDRPPETLY